MTIQIGFTPPDAAEQAPGPVRRRHVVYLPGYDPEAGKRYRALYAREFTRYAKRFDLATRTITRAETRPDGLVQTWTVAAGRNGAETRTTYQVLLADDLVRADFQRPLIASMALLTAGMLHSLVTGKLFRLYGLNWKYGNVILYPFGMVLILGALAALLGTGVAHLLAGWLPGLAAGIVGALAGIGLVLAATPLLDRIFLRQLINDWVFNWQHSNGWRRDYEDRLALFADHVAGIVRAGGVDEVMIVGHSSGGLTAAEVAARVLAHDLPATPRLSLLTLGAGLPLVTINPRARRVRDDVMRLVTSGRLVWADYQAPQDWMNFPGFNPARDLGESPAGPVRNPLIRSTKFREIIDPAVYRRISFRPFRMHFQFLMANDLPGEYDFFALTLGPQALGERVRAPEIVPLRPETPPEPVPVHREI
ncbi:alpha/beta hydrolase [Methylobacterium terricola]|uniref:Alpha/beta hydrolase n=1 Tax=Methylobacterium terricola TaxID=2583531 RepID=A0A5C4L9N7_9HYPH|nr:alpha/beta hydrolase [Methylobacterium terricola]TNC09249.1 alpha/beta hydrolase [Methylobacterium terricola]